jgi:D-arabinan exo alpha-(1,3)/(1,5)-arabinofuranosidase (non-reducing end)
MRTVDRTVGTLAIVTNLAILATLLVQPALLAQQPNLVTEPYLLDTGLTSRSISFENPTGAPGQGGKAASNLGVGRKGAPNRSMKPGESVQLCDIEGPGTIRHIWITTRDNPINLRSCVIRAWWEGQEHPSIECPLGDFMGFAHGKVMPYDSAAHSVGERAGMNIWLPMAFVKRAKFTFTNEGKKNISLYYQIDYTIGDKHPEDVGRLHVLFARENTTTEKKDFELLPQRNAKGRFIGSVIGIRNLHEQWWGEGEIKVYMDGDTDFPTICGTGSEDYVGLSWGIQQTPFLYNGCSLNQNNYVSMYRWHLPDPIAWRKECRITIQQISWKDGLRETEDDWCCATFWYEPTPSAALPTMPDIKARTADIWTDPKPKR